MFYRDERLALFIDGSNLYAAAKSLGFDIDYTSCSDKNSCAVANCCARSTTRPFWKTTNIRPIRPLGGLAAL